MLELENKKEIIELIKKGFDLELISFEFKIPIQELKALKMDWLIAQRNQTKKRQFQNGQNA